MIFTLSNTINSIAGALSELNYPVYDSQTQQGVVTPCFFISLMPSDIKREASARYLNSLSLDIVFLQEPNITNATDLIYEVVDYLNEKLDLFEYSDGAESCMLHAFDRKYRIDNMELHYQITLKVRTYIDVEETKLHLLEDLTYEIKRKNPN